MKTSVLLIAGLAFACGGFAEEGKKDPKEEVERLMHRSREAKEAGRMEEAQKLHAEAERIMAALKEREGMKPTAHEKHAMKHPEGHGSAGPGPEMERLHHLKEAAGHLHAAGFHEQAEGIERAAQHLRREVEEQMKRHQAEIEEQMRRREGEERARKGEASGEPKVRAELEEVRQQMRRMMEQIERLQAELKKQRG